MILRSRLDPFVVGPEEAGKTVQRFLRERAGISHAAARGLIAGGALRVNGRRVTRTGAHLAEGDRVEVAPDPASSYRAPRRRKPTAGYRVVLEDRDIVVVDKEAGTLTVEAPSASAPSVEEALTEGYRRRGFRSPEVLPVHRIDRFTSGLVVFARTRRAHGALRRQFATGMPERVYLAVAEGRVEPEEGRLEDRLAEHPRSLKVHPARGAAGGRKAACRYRVLERFVEATLLEVALETGRRNQIRVQLQSRGHPLVGDVAYGRPSPRIGRTALHAWRLAFDHPTRGARMELVSAPPADFRRLLGQLRRERV